MKTAIQETELYKKFKKALNIHYEMSADDNPFIVECIKVAEEYASQFKTVDNFCQLCPKCYGEGQVQHAGGTSTSLFRVCPVCNGLRVLYRPEFKTVEPEKRAQLLKEIMDTDQEHGMYETEKEEHECTNVETFNGWGNQKCFRCKDCGKTW